MYYVDMPSAEDIGNLNLIRSDACISIYLPTTPVSRDIEQSRTHLGNLVKKKRLLSLKLQVLIKKTYCILTGTVK